MITLFFTNLAYRLQHNEQHGDEDSRLKDAKKRAKSVISYFMI